MRRGNPKIAWKRRALPDAYGDERRVYPPPSDRSWKRSPVWVRFPLLSLDPQSSLRWELPTPSPPHPRDAPDLKAPFGGSLLVRVVDKDASWTELPHAAIEAAKSGMIDAITTDDASKCYVTPYSRWVDPMIRALGDLDREARRRGITIPGETFKSARLAYLHHLIPPVHSVDLGDLHAILLDVHFSVSPGSAWSISKKWLGRA